jgi:uncharacterized protein (TIGR00251 family)
VRTTIQTRGAALRKLLIGTDTIESAVQFGWNLTVDFQIEEFPFEPERLIDRHEGRSLGKGSGHFASPARTMVWTITTRRRNSTYVQTTTTNQTITAPARLQSIVRTASQKGVLLGCTLHYHAMHIAPWQGQHRDGHSATKVRSSVRIAVYVQPRAAKTELVGMHDGLPKIRLAAPPVDGAANAALVEFIASRLKIAKNRVRVVAGLAGRRKWLEIDGLEAGVIAAALVE